MSDRTGRPDAYDDVEGPVQVDEWLSWSITEAFVMAIFIGLGAVIWGLGLPGVGAMMMIVGVLWYSTSPDVQGPIA